MPSRRIDTIVAQISARVDGVGSLRYACAVGVSGR